MAAPPACAYAAGMTGLPLDDVVRALEAIAPLALAEPWDNVGLLLEPVPPRQVRRVLLAIDLGEPVLDEALARKAELVVAYHPPWFDPLRRLAAKDARQRVLLRAAAARVAIHSPHTALDAAPGGLNDWLADGCGAAAARCALQPVLSGVQPALRQDAGVVAGQGRLVVLAVPTRLDELVARLKLHLGATHVRVAAAPDHAAGGMLRRVAVCAGAGGSLVKDAAADLLVTGEMRHHDVLRALERGRSVLLCDHTPTERGFLPILGDRLARCIQERAEVHVSSVDRDPLQTR